MIKNIWQKIYLRTKGAFTKKLKDFHGKIHLKSASFTPIKKFYQALSSTSNPQNIKNYQEEYSQLKNEWKPYIMRGSSNCVELDALSTDQIGSRVSYFNDARVSYANYRMSKGDYSVLLGNSVAYGVGASSDSNCIASQLCRLTENPWYNLAGRAYNQTQEVLSLLLLGAERHKNIVVLSGINNLIFSLAFNQFSGPVMPFWGQNEFNTLNDRKEVITSDKKDEACSLEANYSKMKLFLDRDLQILSAFAKNSFMDNCCAGRLIYVFQPLLAWLNKDLHPSEKCAIDSWDRDTKSLFKEAHKPHNILPLKDRYLDDLATLCRKHGIDFFDMNTAKEFIQSDNLFLDRVHLTDLGQLRAAECIVNYLSL